MTAPSAGNGYALSSRDAMGDGYGFRKVRHAVDVTAFGINAIVLPPGYETGMHYHEVQEETYFVHQGEIEFRFGDGSTHLLGTGGIARVDPATPRGMRNAGNSDAIVLIAGGHDGYVGRDGRPVGTRHAAVRPAPGERRSRDTPAFIAIVAFTLRNLKADLEDLGSRFDGAPGLEFRAATKALALERSALSYQRVPPGYRFPYGHTHTRQEEVYVVLRGSGRMKLDDEIVELRERDAVRVPPGTWRGYEAGAEGLAMIVIGAPNLGEDPREDVEGGRDWWAD